MSDESSVCQEPERVALIVRQPIFTRDQSLWGYSLVSSASHESANGNTVSLGKLVAEQFEDLAAVGVTVCSGPKLLLNVADPEKLSDTDLGAASEGCVCGLSGKAACLSAGARLVDDLHKQGGGVAIDCDAYDDGEKSIVNRCDILRVSLDGRTPMDIVKVCKKFKEFKGDLLATDIPDWESFEGTKALGFKYFHGPFFAAAMADDDASLQAGAISRLQLLRELNASTCEVDDLASIIASDVALSYRILKYINSASFGLKNTIKSIQQAISLLGLNELKRWATLVVMSDIDPTCKGEEVSYMALQRARFLSGLASSVKAYPYSPETMFMLGLFSKLDSLLSYPMEKALADIPMADDLKKALCGEENAYGTCLRMLEAVEMADWPTANGILEKYGVCVTDAATEYLKASRWAGEQLHHMKER